MVSFFFLCLVLHIALSKTEEDAEHEKEEYGEIQKAISWYNRVLGFQIEGGHGK